MPHRSPRPPSHSRSSASRAPHAALRIPRPRWPAAASKLKQALQAGGLLRIAAVYWLGLLPEAARQLRAWDRRAQAICDLCLREEAIGKLTGERLNPEAAALFAILSPAGKRTTVVDLIVAFQLLYDYLDAVNERPGNTNLTNGLHLHQALQDALQPPSRSDIYAENQQHDDSGYARTLTDSCQQQIGRLPSASRYAVVLRHAAALCGEAQASNHAVADTGESTLIAWCQAQALTGYLWWEVAAAGISCLAIHALVARAAQASSDTAEAQRIQAAYFPSVCAISALLDSLADHDLDAATSNHSFTSHYPTPQHASRRLAWIADQSTGVQALPLATQHLTILSGILAYYLSSAAVRRGFAQPVASTLSRCSSRRTRSMLAVMRLRRAASRADPPD